MSITQYSKLTIFVFLSLDSHAAFGQGFEGPVPSSASVSVSDEIVRVEFSWDSTPNFGSTPGRQAVEFSVVTDASDNYLEPIDRLDKNPRYGYDKSDNFPCPYRDVYNHHANEATYDDVWRGLTQYCEYPSSETTAAIATALLFAFQSREAQDRARQFSVGSMCPERFRGGSETYWFEYDVKRIPDGGNFAYAWIHHDRVANFIGCPLTAGDVCGTYFEQVCDREDPPKWIHRLCVPTGTFAFTPGAANTTFPFGTACDDEDRDGFFALQSVPMFGSNVGDCRDDPDEYADAGLVGNDAYDPNTGRCRCEAEERQCLDALDNDCDGVRDDQDADCSETPCSECQVFDGSACVAFMGSRPCADDGISCTYDLCREGVCAHEDNCPSGSSCGQEGTCVPCPSCHELVGESCVPLDGAACLEDGNSCTNNICRNGVCSAEPISNDCGMRVCGSAPSGCFTCGACNGSDTCLNGSCVSTNCPECQRWSGSACVATGDGQSCTSDNNSCTNDTCSGGSCSHTSIANDCNGRVCGNSPSGCFTCGSCGQHGTCDNNHGSCVCDPGWMGPTCNSMTQCGGCNEPCCPGNQCNSGWVCAGGICGDGCAPVGAYQCTAGFSGGDRQHCNTVFSCETWVQDPCGGFDESCCSQADFFCFSTTFVPQQPILRSPAASSIISKSGATFTWDAVTGAYRYYVAVCPMPNGVGLCHIQEIGLEASSVCSGTTCSWSGPFSTMGQGNGSWSVLALSPCDFRAGSYAAWRAATIVP